MDKYSSLYLSLANHFFENENYFCEDARFGLSTNKRSNPGDTKPNKMITLQ